MSACVRFTAAAIACCAALTACGSGFNQSAGSGGASSGDPADSSPVPVPAGLLHLWLGHNAFVHFQPDGTLGYTEDDSWQVSAVDEDVIELRAPEDAEGCSEGDVGRYGWTFAQAGSLLTLTALDDDCQTRLRMLDGTFVRSDCPRFPLDFCLGDLEPGEYPAVFFDPLVPEDEWDRLHTMGAVTYTVPEGWANNGDQPNEYLLQPQDATGETGIYMWSEVAIVLAASMCSPNPDPKIETTPTAMVEWVAHHPTLQTSDPVAVSIDGLEGFMIEASVPANTDLPCTGDGRPYLPMLVGNDADGTQWGFPPEGHKRLYFLDLGQTRVLVISIEAEDEATYRAMVDEATALVESMTFNP